MAAKGGGVTLFGQLVRLIVQLASVMVLARLLPQEDFGIYAMAFAVLGVAQVLGDFGLSMAAVQSQSITQAQRSNLFWTNTGLGLFLFTCAFFGAPLLAVAFGEDELLDIARVLAVTFMLNSVSAQFRAELMIRLRFRALALADVCGAVVGLMVAIGLALSGLGYWALVYQAVSVAAVALVYLVIASRWLPGWPCRHEPMRDLYRFGANTLVVQVFIYMTSNIDSMLVGKFSGAEALGVYDRAFRIFRMPMQQIASPLTKVGVPILSKLQLDSERFAAFVSRGQLILGYAFGGAFFVIAAASDPIVEILLGPGWDEAKPILALLAVGGVFQAMTFVYAWVFLSKALTGLQLRWTVLGRSLMVFLMCVGVAWGALGVAAGSAAGLAANWLILTLFPMKKTGLSRADMMRIAVRPVLLFAPASAAIYFVSSTIDESLSPWLHLAALIALFILWIGSGLLLPTYRRDYKILLATAGQMLSRNS